MEGGPAPENCVDIETAEVAVDEVFIAVASLQYQTGERFFSLSNDVLKHKIGKYVSDD